MHFRGATGTPNMRLAPLQDIWMVRFIRPKSLRSLSDAVHFQAEAEHDRRWIWWCGIPSELGNLFSNCLGRARRCSSETASTVRTGRCGGNP